MTQILGRERELATLQARLDDALLAKGSTLFISGEAGIGKTRLAEECISAASAKGFKVMRGWCLNSCLTPYMPMRELLGSGGLERLITLEAPPRLETAFLIMPTGIVLSKFEREGSGIDGDIFTGMLTAVNEFIKDTMRQMGRLPEGDVSRLGHGDFNISAVHGRAATLAAIYKGRENEALLSDLQQTLASLEGRFGEKLARFDGAVDEFAEAGEMLKALFDSEKFEGVDWAKGDPKSKQSGIFENVAMGLQREAKKQPLLLFVDDLQWADPSTLALLHYVSRNTRASSILVLGTYRSEDILESWDGKAHPLNDAMQLMGGEGLLGRIELRNLERGAVAGIVGAHLGKVEGDAEFVDFLWRETQGNPLFAIEVINLLKGEGALARKGEVWNLTRGLQNIDVPAKIHDVISRRLARLLTEQRRILEPASVIGDIFSSDVLSRVAEMKKLELLKSLNEIERSHGLIVSMERKYAFSHVKIRDVLYGGLSGELKMEYHQIVGDTMSDLHGPSDDAAAEIGYHYYMARNPEEAVPRLRRAIELAKGKFANDEALRYCNYALELMGADPGKWGTETVQALEDAGDVYEISGNYDKAITAFEKIGNLSSDPETNARAHRRLASLQATRGHYDRMLDELEKGRALVAGAGSAELGRIISAIGLVHEHRGEYDKAIAMQDEALEILRGHGGTERDIADVLHKIGQLYVDRGDYDRGLDFYKRSLVEFEKMGYQKGIGTALNSIGHILADRDRYADALEVFERCLRTFEKLGDPMSTGIALNNLGIVYKSTSDYDKALANYERCLEVFKRLGHPRGIGSSLNNIAIIYHTRGDHARALAFHERALAIFEEMGDKVGAAMMRLNMSLVYVQMNDFENAWRNITAAEKATLELGNKRLLVDIGQAIGEILVRTGRPDEAEEKFVKAIALSKEMDLKETEGISHRFLGSISDGRKKWEEAAAHFEKSISVLSEASIKIELAETYLEYGRALKKRGDEKAKVLLSEALRIFGELKLEHKVEAVSKEIAP
jgi:tetratricopeptide (TPR) repeat protein